MWMIVVWIILPGQVAQGTVTQANITREQCIDEISHLPKPLILIGQAKIECTCELDEVTDE